MRVHLVIVFLSLIFSSGVNAECNLGKTPLNRGDNCSWYMKKDKELNSAYKTLSKSLNKDKLTLLKKTQREWIVWRDEKCDAEQEESGCTGSAINSSCNDVAHDECIIDLTEQRTLELNQFIKNPLKAGEFEFSRKYKSSYHHD